MDSEKGNRVFARGHNVPPPWFLEPKKSLVWLGLTLSRAGFFGAPGMQGGGGHKVPPPPSENPVPILRIYSSKIFRKACPKLSLVKQTWFPWQPWLWF